MIDPHAIISRRRYGEIRYAVVSSCGSDMSQILAKFGLTADESLLVEHDRESALAILTHLLWKDMAYESECMPKHEAKSLAQGIMAEHERPGTRYFSNGNVAESNSWNPLTASTFDAGLLMTDDKEREYFCIWFQDED